MKKLLFLFIFLPFFTAACAPKSYEMAGNWDSMKYTEFSASVPPMASDR